MSQRDEEEDKAFVERINRLIDRERTILDRLAD
jgi:hypothetical protein